MLAGAGAFLSGFLTVQVGIALVAGIVIGVGGVLVYCLYLEVKDFRLG